MATIAGLGGALFLLSTIIGGARLLLLARRTRELPEFVLGMALFLMGGVATPLAALSRLPLDLAPGVAATCFVMSSLILTLGCAGFTAFTQRVFRPSALWARCLVLVLPGMMLGGFVTTGLHIGFDAARLSPDGGYYLFQGALLLSMGWCAVESIRVADSLRRRVRIGLADPVVANRVQLWGGAMIVATLMSGASLGGQLVGIDLIGSVAGLTFVGCFGSVAAGGIYLAFLPPAAYTRWISAAAARRS